VRHYLLFILGLTTGLLSAQSYAFLQWTVADGLPAIEVSALAEDDNGYLWVGTAGGGAARFDGKSFMPLTKPPGNFVHKITNEAGKLSIQTEEGSIWLHTFDNRFKVMCGETDSSEAPPTTKEVNDLPNLAVQITSSLRLPGGNLLAGTQEGLYLVGSDGATLGHYTAPSNLPGTRVTALLKDRQNRIWIGTDGGLARMVPSELRRITNRKTTAIAPSQNNSLWLGQDRNGIFTFTGSSNFERPDIDDPSRGRRITSITKDGNGHTFFSTDGRGITVVNDTLGVERLTARSGLPDNRILAVLAVDSNQIWAVSYDQGIGLISFQDSIFNVQSFGPDEGVPLTNFTAALRLPGGALMLGDRLGNIYSWQPTDTTLVFGTANGLPRGPISAMGLRHETQLWVAIAGHGLFYTSLEMDDLRFAPMPKRFGKLPATINTIFTPKNKSELWLGTDRNLIRVYLNREGRPDWFRTYGRAEGFPSAAVTSAIAANNKYYFGTTKGLVELTPDDADGYLSPPPAFLTVNLFYKELNGKDFECKNSTAHFSAANNHLGFQFGAVDLTHPDRVRFQWRLAPYEKEWSPITDETSVRYTSLSAGSYNFEVRATTDGGKTWGKKKGFAFVIATPFWRKGWVWALVALVGAALLTGGFYTFYQRIQRSEASKRKALEAQNQLLTLEQKALQLQMNPHFIFNALNGIRGLVDGKNDAEARLQIGRFAKLMRGILNNSRRETIPLSEEISTLTEYLEMERFCQPFDFTYTISPPENIDPEEVNMPSMLLQPFLENAVLHGLSSLKGRTGHINVSFIMRGRGMQCTVEDNGIGRSAAAERKAGQPTSHKSVALDVTQARLKTMKGRMGVFDVEDSEGGVSGTRVELFFPVESW
jgi:ligand-binding sensor domain-containing protein/anti-sigma regulatory factor (Ser/Thr protein kinase)